MQRRADLAPSLAVQMLGLGTFAKLGTTLAAAPRVAPETVGQRVLKRSDELPWVSGPPLAPPQQPPNPPVERFAPRPADLPDVDLAALEARFHIADFRDRYNVPTTHTVAVGRTNVPGLEDITFEGASPKVWKKAKRRPRRQASMNLHHQSLGIAGTQRKGSSIGLIERSKDVACDRPT